MPPINLLSAPPRLPLVAPSILAADFASLGAECAAAIEAGADLLHLDVMDGHFVPNLTMGPGLCRSLRRSLPSAFLDVHLMITNPEAFVAPFADAGADHLTVHVEVCPDPEAMASTIREAGLTAGIAISPPTPVEQVLPHVEAFDLVLVMSVNPGFGGQAFIASVLEKVRTIRDRLRPDQRLQMDGGIGIGNAETCRVAGCDVIVAGSACFGAPDLPAAVAGLRGGNAGELRGNRTGSGSAAR